MASKRAYTSLSVRFAPTILRSQSSLPHRALAQAQASILAVQAPIQRPIVQRRWHAQNPGLEKSRAYQFDDIRKLVESPEAEAVLIDVREPAEYEAGYIPTAINIPITSNPDALLLPADEFEDRFGFQKPPPSTEVVFYCKAGVRSSAAAQLARQGGYEKVGEYRGSWMDWERNGGVGSLSEKPEGKPGGESEPKV